MNRKYLTDEEYAGLKDYASRKNIALYGYQVKKGAILLNNSKTNNIYGDTIDELKKAIDNA